MPTTPSRESSAGVFVAFALCCFRFVVFFGVARLGDFARVDFLSVLDVIVVDLDVADLVATDLVVAMSTAP